MVQGDDGAGGARGVPHDVGEGLSHDGVDQGADPGVLGAEPGLGQGGADAGGPHRGEQLAQAVPAARPDGVAGCGWEGGQGVDGVTRVGQALAGEGVNGANGLVEVGVAGGARQPLGQGDDRGEVVPSFQAI